MKRHSLSIEEFNDLLQKCNSKNIKIYKEEAGDQDKITIKLSSTDIRITMID